MTRSLLLLAFLFLTGCTSSRLILADHPLVGRIWDVAARRFLTPQEAEERIAAADIALLGEIHDNPEQHRLQLRLLENAAARGGRPALVLEQIDTEWQGAVDDVARASGASPAEVAQAGRVASGWHWPFYRPLVAQALKANLPIVAANLSRNRARTIAAEGYAALGPGEAERLGLNQPWTPGQNAALRRLLVEGHCGDDSPMIDRLVPVQRARDAVMADRILERSGRAVAMVGRVHARADIGVPLYLKAADPDKKVLSVGFMEVVADQDQPADYPEAAPGLHDLLWFTPQARRKDPCQGMSRGR